jgi:uncharacterized membrane protein YraQ (UPF0718 family)
MNWLWLSLYHALAMLWSTFWALVLGFTISAALQVFVSKEQMSRAFGKTNLKSISIATGLGAASSSCSYAAAAAARSAIQQGAAIIPALAFMFASTNLVIELGAVLWILMGWRFVLAEFIGALVLIALVGFLVRFFMPKTVQDEIHRNAEKRGGGDDCCHHSPSQSSEVASEHEQEHERENERGGKWNAMANAFVMDWLMMWKELLIGFLIAGFIATLVPHSWWSALFLQSGSHPLRVIENALVGPIIAVASFVCSVGNIPLASHLWSNGISFGGVISFIYADLLVIPLILIYAKYYGTRAATYITIIFYVATVVAGLVVDLLFHLLGLIPTGPRPPSAVQHAMISWNYTTWLDILAAIVGGFFLVLYSRNRDSHAMHHAHH